MKTIEDILNSKPDSLCLHDGCLLGIKFNNNELICKFMIDEYTLEINSEILNQYNKYMILYEKFTDIKIINISFDSTFDFCCSEIIKNEFNGNIFKLYLQDDIRNIALIEFEFKKFNWIFDKYINKIDINNIYELSIKNKNDNIFIIDDSIL